jgi:hypothetical protein
MNKLDPFVDSHPTSATSDADIRTLPARSGQGSIDQEGHHTPRGEVGQGFAGSTATGHESTTDGKSHHLGRDTVVAGGVGAAAYEADKHHRKDEIAQPTAGQSTIHPSTTTTGPRSSAVGADTSKDHHYGRDAAVAGGVGGAAYEAEKHHKHDKDLTQAERDAKKEHKHELKEEKKHKHEEKEKKGGLLGFLREYQSTCLGWNSLLTVVQTETRTRATLLKKKPNSIAKNANTMILTKDETPV